MANNTSRKVYGPLVPTGIFSDQKYCSSSDHLADSESKISKRQLQNLPPPTHGNHPRKNVESLLMRTPTKTTTTTTMMQVKLHKLVSISL
jgi:hypothetical protein